MPGKYGKYSGILESNTYGDVSSVRTPEEPTSARSGNRGIRMDMEMEIVSTHIRHVRVWHMFSGLFY